MLARIGLVALALAAFAVPPPARAEQSDHIAVEPGATLLLPYFEVALTKKPGGKPKGVSTVFTVHNAKANAVLTHVTIWSDLSVPVLFFDMYLTGFDAVTVDLAEVMRGNLPQTASAGQDAGDAISPKGPASQDVVFASCGIALPPPPLPAGSIEHLRTSLTGQPSPLFGNQCLGRDHGEKKPLARGYVTVDVVNSCSLLFPGDVGYFGSVTATSNQLFGDYYVVDRAKKRVFADNLVSVRVHPGDLSASETGFYSRLDQASSPLDQRQPLGARWTGRFTNDPKDRVFPGGSDAIVWRDVKRTQGPIACGTNPPYFPLIQEELLAFDEEETVERLEVPAVPPLPPQPVQPFPAATQRVRVGGADLPTTFARGFLYLNLNTAVIGQTAGPADPAAAQSFVTMVHATKRQPLAVRGTALDSPNTTSHNPIGP